MAANRCPDCNKFVSFNLGEDPEVEDDGNGKAKLTLTVTLTRVCAECGTELQSGNTDIEVEADLKDIEFEEVA